MLVRLIKSLVATTFNRVIKLGTGGLGVIGGLYFTPDELRTTIREVTVKQSIRCSSCVGTDTFSDISHSADSTERLITSIRREPSFAPSWRISAKDKCSRSLTDSMKYSQCSNRSQWDYTEGKLDELIDIVVCSGAKLFVSAVGVAPKDVVEKLHANGIFYMNLVGHPKHVAKACTAGADIICAQGSEAGGHTGEIPTRCVHHHPHFEESEIKEAGT
jgi:NAD(P)H-dependent flavin oxidoreductase YrpB (nitropropane dioxygenase family)